MHWNGKEQTLLELSIAGSEDEWKLLFVVNGYHVYKHMWDSYLEDECTTKHQRCQPSRQVCNRHTTGGQNVFQQAFLGLLTGRFTVFPHSVNIVFRTWLK